MSCQPKSPIFQNKVENLIKNREDLQKYLLATEDLNKTIEESLQLAVGHGKINDESAVRHVSDRDDPPYKFFKENDNPLDVVYRKQAKVDVQNPIIGSLLQQINKSKFPGYEETQKILEKGPDPNAFDLEDRFNKSFDRERPGQKGLVDKYFDNIDNDDDDDSPPGSPGVLPAPSSQNLKMFREMIYLMILANSSMKVKYQMSLNFSVVGVAKLIHIISKLKETILLREIQIF